MNTAAAATMEMELVVNMSILVDYKIDTAHSNETTTLSPTGKLTPSEAIEEFIYTKMILAVCVFGIAGNLLNFVVLSRKSLTYLMERMEKSVHYGLISLAVSDFFVCLASLSTVVHSAGKNRGRFAHTSFDFRLVHKLYGVGVINTFMLSSTWLTVTMAVSRYIAICHPLKARQIIGKTFTVASLVAVFVLSVLFNVPRFLWEEPRSVDVGGGRRVYFAYPGPLKLNPGATLAYSWTYFTFGIVVPLCVLVFCNAHLIKALRRSVLLSRSEQPSIRRSTRSNTSQRTDHREQSAYRITLTLIVIIILFLVLFVPSELLNFFVDLATQSQYNTQVFNVAMAVGNLLQTINFAVNFVLYSAVNTYFRYTIRQMLSCAECRSTDSSEVFRSPKLAINGETIRLFNFEHHRFADPDQATAAERQQLSINLMTSQDTPTIVVSSA